MRYYNRYSKIYLFIPAYFICACCIAQTPNTGLEVAKMQFMGKQVVPPSPDAAELGKYGNVPISLFTGTPSISVPLMELKGNDLSLPVSLTYNASGFRPEDAASWVGSSWALNAGGVITRSVMGNPDNDANYFGVTNLFTPPNNLDIIPYYNYMKDIQNGTKETRPDVYYYNFAGHSGKFVLRPDQSVVKKERDLKIITPCITGNCNESNFKIVDEQGITYIFSQIETTTMYPNDAVGQPSNITYIFASAWYLTSMISASNNEVIEFEYHTTTNPQVLYQNMLPNKSVSFTYGTKKGQADCAPTIVSELTDAMNTPPTVSIKRKFLEKITFKKANIVVAYIDIISGVDLSERLDSDFGEDRRVDQVKLYSTVNETNILIKHFNFYYSYFGDTGTGSQAYLQKRLRLDSVHQIATNVNTASPPPYVFTYNVNCSPRFTASLDHWGFYNATGNSSLVPNVYFPGSFQPAYYFNPLNVGDGSNREATLIGSSATMLTRMQYPTGGYTTFEYELNKAKFEDNSIHEVGGVRIKQIIDYSFSNKQAIAKNYMYVLSDGTTSGRAGIFPVYHTNSTYHNYNSPTASCGTGSPQGCCSESNEHAEYELYTISVSANSVYGLGSFQGTHLGYSEVTESQVNLATGESLGKTVNKYNLGQYLEYEEDIKNGDLIQQTVFNNDGKLLQESTSTYQYSLNYDIVAQVVKGNEMQSNKPYYCKIGTNDFYNFGAWQNSPSSCTEIGNYPTKLSLSNYSIFSQNKQLVSQTHKVYDQLTNKYISSTKNYTYNYLHNYPIEIEDVASNGEKIITDVKYAIDYDISSASGTLANHIKDLVQKNIPGAPIEKLQYRLYPDNSKKYLNGQITNYYLNYPLGIYFLEANPPLTSVTPSAITSGNLAYDSHYRLAGTFSYTSLNNLEQQSKTNDVVKSYLWDYNSQYPVAEIIGTSYLVSYTSFETSYKGNFSFSGTPQTESTSPTGRRAYSLAGGSINATVSSSATYIVSYWRNSASNYTVSGSVSTKQGGTHNGWTYFEHTVSGVSTTTISGSGLIDEVRVYQKGALMTTSTYDPLIGTTSRCDANNHIMYYEYDGLNRLINVKDDDRNIVKNFKYNYGLGSSLTASSTTLYYNADTVGTYVKNNCSGSSVPDTVLLRIGYGKYASVISQADANSKAREDIIANGQAYANTNGGCYFYNTSQQSSWTYKDDCPYAKGPGNALRYTVPAGRYKSATSQTDANNMALADITANVQAYVNANAGCSCEQENRRYVSGTCETGTRINDGTFQQTNGQWVCVYHYEFSNGNSEEYYETSSSPCSVL